MTAHWGIEDLSHVEGTDIERERAFVTALRYLENRIDLFTARRSKSSKSARSRPS
jgi:arsenate reductase